MGKGTGLLPHTKLAGKRDLLRVDDRGLVPRCLVEDRLHRHRALRQLGQVAALEVLGDGVVESPERAALELVMARLAELLHGFVDVPCGESLRIDKLDKKVRGAFNLSVLVSVDPLAHVNPVGGHAGNGRRKNPWKVFPNVDRVTASQLHIRREAKILADHHLIADCNRSRERAVMRVTQTKNNLAIIPLDVITPERETAKVAVATTRKRVFLFHDLQTSAVQSLAGKLHKGVVRDWSVATLGDNPKARLGFVRLDFDLGGRNGLRSVDCCEGLNVHFVSCEYQ